MTHFYQFIHAYIYFNTIFGARINLFVEEFLSIFVFDFGGFGRQ